jgi:GxGYxYP putative glycoside hydrolase C-terminal domain/GxGYxY sequence motif in domain of unknown function N-terminal
MPGLSTRRQFLGAAAGAVAGVAAVRTGPAAAARASMAGPSGPGISWPAGQALPSFTPPMHLDVADLRSLSVDLQLLATTLQGVVNRNRPRIFVLQQQNEGATTWLDGLGVPYTEASGPASLLAAYRSEIQGAIVYDPAVPGTINVATTLAGLRNCVVTSADLAASYNLPVAADLRDRFATDLAAYSWALSALWPAATHRMVIGLDPGISSYLRDYAVANRAFVMFLNPGIAAERALLGRLLADMPTGSPYLGWWPANVSGESGGTQLASQHGKFVVASDGSLNLTVFGGVPAAVRAAQYRAPTPPLEDKIYITLTMTEGDNLSYNQHRMRQIWDDPNRGKVPLNWTTQPLAVDAAPAFLSYYQRTASHNDYLMAGPSGAGYVYPSEWPASALGVYTQQTARYTDRTGIAAGVILNRAGGQDIPLGKATAEKYVQDVRPLGLLMSWTNYTQTSVLARTTPLSVSRLASTTSEAAQAIAAASAGWDGTAPLFLSIGTLAWKLTPTDAMSIAGALGPKYQVVRGDQYFSLARQAFGLPPT